MKNEVGPAASTSRAKLSLTPRTTDASATTTKTPTATPMIVRNARTLLARIDSIASETPSKASSSRFMIRIAFSLLAKRLDGIEPRRPTGGVCAGGDSDDESEQGGDDERPGRNGGGEEGKLPGDPLGDGDAERDADECAERTQRRCLGEKLAHDVPAARA